MEHLTSGLSPTVNGRTRGICCHSATLSGRFPPNSLSAVRECVAAGVPRLEVDVRFLGDDAMVVFHDSNLGSATTADGRIDEAVRADVLKARYRDNPQFGVCFLEDVVAALAGGPTLLQVDLKLMRPIGERRARQLEDALAPMAGHVIVGSQAHWNLRALRGLPVALDPTLQWCYAPDNRPPLPRTIGVHGLWDDSPVATNARFSAEEYIEERIIDIRGLLPMAVEWMVDFATVFRLEELGVNLGDRLRAENCSLSAWTIRRGQAGMAEAVERLFRLGVETIITDAPMDVSASISKNAV